jgi:hypothetical protein
MTQMTQTTHGPTRVILAAVAFILALAGIVVVMSVPSYGLEALTQGDVVKVGETVPLSVKIPADSDNGVVVLPMTEFSNGSLVYRGDKPMESWIPACATGEVRTEIRVHFEGHPGDEIRIVLVEVARDIGLKLQVHASADGGHDPVGFTGPSRIVARSDEQTVAA